MLFREDACRGRTAQWDPWEETLRYGLSTSSYLARPALDHEIGYQANRPKIKHARPGGETKTKRQEPYLSSRSSPRPWKPARYSQSTTSQSSPLVFIKSNDNAKLDIETDHQMSPGLEATSNPSPWCLKPPADYQPPLLPAALPLASSLKLKTFCVAWSPVRDEKTPLARAQ